MKLHLGCGKRNFGSDWIHIDQEDYPHITRHDVTNLLVEDGACELIYASHLINYFDREEIVPVLKEWARSLNSGGILRLAVPNFKVMANLYTQGYTLDSFLGPLYGKMNRDKIYHKTAYDFSSLRDLLLECGFSSVDLYDWRDTDHAEFDDHSQAYLPHMDKENGVLLSLNVEATK